MKHIRTPEGLNERLLHAIEQETRPLAAELAATERYLRRFRRMPLPQPTQRKLLQAVTAPPVRPPYRLYRRAAAGIAAALLLPGLWLLIGTDKQAPVVHAAPAATPAALPAAPAYIVHDREDGSDFCLLAPVVIVSDDVL